MITGFPFLHSCFNTTGKADTVNIPVANVRVGDRLLYLIAYTANADGFEALDVNDFTVGTGVIVSATVDTDGKLLAGAWAPPADAGS